MLCCTDKLYSKSIVIGFGYSCSLSYESTKHASFEKCFWTEHSSNCCFDFLISDFIILKISCINGKWIQTCSWLDQFQFNLVRVGVIVFGPVKFIKNLPINQTDPFCTRNELAKEWNLLCIFIFTDIEWQHIEGQRIGPNHLTGIGYLKRQIDFRECCTLVILDIELFARFFRFFISTNN